MIVIAGSNFVAVRFSNEELPPFWGATLRFAIACALFFVVMRWRGAALPRGRALAGVAIYGALGFGAFYALMYWALVSVPAGLASVLVALVPLLTFFLAIAHGLETFQLRGLVGALIALVGIAVVFVEQLGGAVEFAALLACIAAAVCAAESTVLAKLFPRVDPAATNAVGILAGLMIPAPLSLVAGETWTVPQRIDTILAVAYLVTIGSVGLFALFLYGAAALDRNGNVVSPRPLTARHRGGRVTARERAETPQFALGGAFVGVGVYVGALSARITDPA